MQSFVGYVGSIPLVSPRCNHDIHDLPDWRIAPAPCQLCQATKAAAPVWKPSDVVDDPIKMPDGSAVD